MVTGRAGEATSGASGTASSTLEAELKALAGSVPDPELPVLTLDDLGVVRGAHVRGPGRVEVELTPTYTGCPALESMAEDIRGLLGERGWEATVSTVLSPAWSTDWISDEGRRKLAEFGIAPPEPVRRGPVFVELGLGGAAVRCPHCGCADTRLLSRFSSTACKALRSCGGCGEPFEHIKEL